MNRKQHSRNKIGSITMMSIVLFLFTIIIGIGFFNISMILGGSIQFRNAVDAGMLSVARDTLQSPQININAAALRSGASPEEALDISKQLQPLCEKDSRVTLSSINRLAAASLLVEMNEYAMQKEGSSTGITGSTQDARHFDETTAEIAKELANRYQHREERIEPFIEVTSANHNNMLGLGSAPIPELRGWDSSFLNQRTATNVYMDKRQVPDGYDEKNLPISQISLNNVTRNYVCGYTPIEADSAKLVRPSKRSYFVPLRPGLKPHLIHSTEFKANQLAPVRIEADYAVPNGISSSARGHVKAQQFLSYTSYAVVEGQDEGYAAALPAAYIRIENSADSNRPVKLSDYIFERDLKDINSRIKQRVWEIDPAWDAGEMKDMFGQEIRPGKKIVITDGRQAQRPTAHERDSKPDGNDSIAPSISRDGTIFQWVPSSGSNGLLGVLTITSSGGLAK